MPKRNAIVPDIGEVVLAKHRRGTNMRLSISASGQVRLGLPYWAPYNAGLLFIHSKKDWIQKQLAVHAPSPLYAGAYIGKTHKLEFYDVPARHDLADSKIITGSIEIRSKLGLSHPAVQKAAIEACEKALKQEAMQLLPARLHSISIKYGLPYRKVRIRKLTSRWGSCSAKGDVSLSSYLIQLPWELIDYVILHELAHTRFLNHGSDFWDFMKERLPNVRNLRKQIKMHKSRIEPALRNL